MINADVYAVVPGTKVTKGKVSPTNSFMDCDLT